ncbi:MAG: hypothetical protein A2293_00035 [Elusimicrobia bacterium RIFOXYB2_FULL_49_7]|nr:MAG: hypothetical protein A2293_00035 [Elusimicrobia bacterium RIFOXYB2_FULL_49_7]
MKRLTLVLAAVFFVSLSVPLFSQLQLDDQDEAERVHYGLSQAEWQMFKQSGMSITELERLVECGITMNEYNSRPWMSVGVSEKMWIQEKCKGMSNEGIQAFHEKGEGDHGVLFAFLLPGSYHWLNKSYGKATLLSSTFALSVSFYFLLPLKEDVTPSSTVDGGHSGTEIRKTRRPAFIIIAAGDMLLSAILAYRNIHRTKLQDEMPEEASSSLHFNYHNGRPGLACSWKF